MATIKNSFLNILIKTKKYNYGINGHVPLILILLHYDINQTMLLLYHNHIFNYHIFKFDSDH